tara:strand:- start:708 stop:1838 length:1131 start_codon:yes stop_codon:yes gene_type:complete
MIKFWSYKKEYLKNKKNILNVIDRSIRSGSTFFGKNLSDFEKNFTKKYNSLYGVAVGSGTDAILISLMSIGIKQGDEIITASNTAIPTISAIISSGAKPKLVDINKEDYLINVDKIEKLITSKTKAIIPVHLYGQSADLKKILSIAKKYKIKVVEDCAQAQGATYKNKYVGTFGHLGCFSFYPTKILGAYGDGGFILTQNYQLYKKIKRIRFYGIETSDKNNKFNNKYYANENGINSRLDEIQASILNYKLKQVDKFIKRRREIAKIYKRALLPTSLKLPKENKGNTHVYHLFTVFHRKSKKIIEKLKKNKIETRVIYPYPIQKMKPYKKLNLNNLKNSEIISKGIFSLPLYPELKNKDVIIICKKIKKILKKLNF